MGQRSHSHKVPKSALPRLVRYWGDVPLEFFEAVAYEMSALAYRPCDWSGQNIAFVKNWSDDVHVFAQVRCTVPHYSGLPGSCDIAWQLGSRLLAARSSPDDPWMPGVGARVPVDWRGVVTFHRDQLSHLAWAQAEQQAPRAWVPTAAGLSDMMQTYRRLVDDVLPPLATPAGLAAFIQEWSTYEQPPWVAAQRPLKPGTRFANQFLRLLRAH